LPETCPKCGAELQVGDWPLCGGKHAHAKANLSTHPDDVPGGFWAENGFPKPRWFPSHSEHRAALAARGLEIGAKWAGPLDKIMTRWDAPDATTLANAKVLVSRTKAEPFAPEERIPITVTPITFERPV
jgi:hypothetical protein